jgi:cytidine deaminase
MKPTDLVARALEARNHAYAPYSGYPVGAAVLTSSGNVFTGCNVENASFGLTVCAERVAILKAVSEGDTVVTALAVVTEGGATMCGACRQVLYEFGSEAKVYLADPSGTFRETDAKSVLPEAFDGGDLPQKR